MIDGILPITSDRLNSLNDEVIRFGKLLNNLNSLKQFETEDIPLNIDTVFLGDLVTDVCDGFETIAKGKNIHIDLQLEPKKFMILGDADKLKQVFINLIINAIAYTPIDGEVKVSLQEHEDNVRIHVKDTGVGIEKEEIPRIFERFYRVDRARSRNSGGTGLGLAIVKHLVEAHHGNIIVNSVIGKGSEFIIELHKR
jgi:two-component system phosphate regulon sensor histidine kinase PhoR